MTIVLFDQGTLYTDSKKLNYLQNSSMSVAISGEKIRVIAEGAIAYASCGVDPNLNERHTLENHVRSVLFSSWLGREASINPSDPQIRAAMAIWMSKYQDYYPEPMDPHHMIVMTQEIVLNLKYEGLRNVKPNKPGCTYLDITGESNHVLSVSPASFNIYKRLGMTTTQALKRVIDTTDLCDYPIQLKRQSDLEPTNYRDFLQFLIDQDTLEKQSKKETA